MKFSLNFVKAFGEWTNSGDITAIGVDKLIEKIGAQLGGVDEVIRFGDKYNGIVIVKVLSCQKHPNADKLKVCMIDNGEDRVQVVCGAPNVHEGMLAAWLPPGATVPDTYDKEPFKLEAREIRGVVSNGMLASSKELALGDSHEGILEIEGEAKPGADFAETFDLKDDIIIDVENKMFTHRPDCFGFMGIARELAGIQQLQFKSPDWYTPNPEFPKPEADELPLKIINELPDEVPRFTAVTLRGVKVGPSPAWLQVFLAKVGQKSINNIVDYTNWFMLLTGQPLHAYDYDKVKALSQSEATIVVRNPKPSEKLKLLNGKEIQPRPKAIMIATNKTLIGLGGVMGGAETEVDENTTNVILECANFDMYSIRRTSMEHGLFTDAVTRFTKGQSPLQNLAVLARIVTEIREHAGGKVASPVIDDRHFDETPAKVQITAEFINQRLGTELPGDKIADLLKNVEFGVDTNSELNLTAPFWRTDIYLREDIVEEVGRLYGYDQLPLTLPKRVIEPTAKDPLLTLKAQIRGRLSRAGANEVLTYSFVHGDLLDRVGQDKKQAFQIANALSPDLQYYRMSLVPSLLDKVHMNIKAGYDELALFEIGKVHTLDHKSDEGLPGEHEFTSLVIAANDKLNKVGAPYYQALTYLQNLAGVELEFKPVSKDMQAYAVVAPYDLNRAALVSIKGGDFLGIIGEFKASVRRSLKLPKYTAGFEVDTTVLQQAFAKSQVYTPLPRFPKVTQDITLKAPADLSYQDLVIFLAAEFDKVAPENSLHSLEITDIYQPEKTDSKNLTFRLSIASYERTLTDAEVNIMLDKIAESAKNKFKAERV